MSVLKISLTHNDSNVYSKRCQAKITITAINKMHLMMKMRFNRLFIAYTMACVCPLAAQETADEEFVTDGLPGYLSGAAEEVQPVVPELFRDDALLDESHANRELGVNVYTSPSIAKIFAQLEDLPPVPEEYVLRNRPSRLSTASGKVALEMGFLLADGFIAVCSGHMNDVKPIALELTRYGRALGVGDKMEAHSAALLEQAEKGNRREFKKILIGTQSDVNAELSGLGDPDLSHLIALGGWVRAYEASTAALCDEFSAEDAAIVFYPDAPDYFSAILRGIDPATARKLEIEPMCMLLDELTGLMTLADGEQPTAQKVEQLRKVAGKLAALIAGEEYAH